MLLFFTAFQLSGCRSSSVTTNATICSLSKNIIFKLGSTTCRIDELLVFSILNIHSENIYISNPKSYSNLHLTLLEMNDSVVARGNRINGDLKDRLDFFQLDAGKSVNSQYVFSLSNLFMVQKKKTYKLVMEFDGLIKENEGSRACEIKIKFMQILNTE